MSLYRKFTTKPL